MIKFNWECHCIHSMMCWKKPCNTSMLLPGKMSQVFFIYQYLLEMFQGVALEKLPNNGLVCFEAPSTTRLYKWPSHFFCRYSTFMFIKMCTIAICIIGDNSQQIFCSEQNDIILKYGNVAGATLRMETSLIQCMERERNPNMVWMRWLHCFMLFWPYIHNVGLHNAASPHWFLEKMNKNSSFSGFHKTLSSHNYDDEMMWPYIEVRHISFCPWPDEGFGAISSQIGESFYSPSKAETLYQNSWNFEKQSSISLWKSSVNMSKPRVVTKRMFSNKCIKVRWLTKVPKNPYVAFSSLPTSWTICVCAT